MIKRIKIWTMILHSMIIIGAGHGIGILGIMDIACIPKIIENGIQNNNFGDFGDNLILVGLISLIGKIVLIISLFMKKEPNKNIAGLIGLFILWVSFYVLVSGNWNYDSLYELAFWTGLPFLFCSIVLFVLFFKNFDRIENLNEKGIENNEKASL